MSNNTLKPIDGVAHIDLINRALSRSEGVAEMILCVGELAELSNSMDVVKPESLSSVAAVIIEEMNKIREHSEALFDAYSTLKRQAIPEPPLIGRTPPKTAGEA